MSCSGALCEVDSSSGAAAGAAAGAGDIGSRDMVQQHRQDACSAVVPAVIVAAPRRLLSLMLSMVVAVDPPLEQDVQRRVHLVLVVLESSGPSLRGTVIPILE